MSSTYQRPDAPMKWAVVVPYPMLVVIPGHEYPKPFIAEYPPGVSYWDEASEIWPGGIPARAYPTAHLQLIGESDCRDGGPSSSYPTADAIIDAFVAAGGPVMPKVRYSLHWLR